MLYHNVWGAPVHLPQTPKCKLKVYALCSRPKEWKVPDLLLLRSQMEKLGEKGGMQMSSGDLKETKKQLKTAKNKADLEEAEEKRDRKLADER